MVFQETHETGAKYSVKELTHALSEWIIELQSQLLSEHVNSWKKEHTVDPHPFRSLIIKVK